MVWELLPNAVLIEITGSTKASILIKVPAGHFSNVYRQHKLYIVEYLHQRFGAVKHSELI